MSTVDKRSVLSYNGFMTNTSRMYLTAAEAKDRNLPSAQEQIDRWNKLQKELRQPTATPAKEEGR